MYEKPGQLVSKDKTVPRTAPRQAPQTSRQIRTKRTASRCPECGGLVVMPCLECAVGRIK